jgi:hypothetical protein
VKTVISASRRTDIPAFYLNNFIEAIRRGSVIVANPFYPGRSSQVDLRPESVSWIVFWSRNYKHFLKKREIFAAYNLFFHFTILPASKLEKASMPVKKALSQLQELCAYYGGERIIWRYDPVHFWIGDHGLCSNHDPAFFREMCREISSFGVRSCYTSFVHPYQKYRARLGQALPQIQIHLPEAEERRRIAAEMAETAAQFQIHLHACCNDDLLTTPGVYKGHCIDGELLNRLSSGDSATTAHAPSRAQCGCTRSIDIGDYRKQPCYFGCMYCYANPVWRSGSGKDRAV